MQYSPNIVNGMFSPVFNLAVKYFAEDLNSTVLSSLTAQRRLSIGNGSSLVPILASNSPTAKKMRVAAVIATIAASLEQHIFHPNYLVPDGDQMSEYVLDLAERDAEVQAHCRGILLNTMPKMQAKSAQERLRNTSEMVSGRVANWLPEPRKTSFHADLQEVCRSVFSRWSDLQRVEHVIYASFDLTDAEDWVMIPYPSVTKKPAETKNKQKVVTGKTKPGNNKTDNPKAGNTKSGGPSQKQAEVVDEDIADDDIANIVVPIWPCFKFVNGDQEEDDIIVEGAGLTSEEMRAAEEEISSTSVPTARIKRQATRSRRLSVSDKPFLSQNGNGVLVT